MVSAVCITYGRPNLLEEAIECFLRQTFQGDSELVILNDMASQELFYEHPKVRIINSPVRFRTIGEKRNACASLSRGDILFPWDDDDIHLPHRIEFSLEKMGDRDFFNPRKACVWMADGIKKPEGNGFPSIACYTRSLFDSVRGYAHINSGQDSELEARFKEKTNITTTKILDDEVYYLYRWSHTGSYHLSAYGQDSKTGRNGMQSCDNFLSSKKEMPNGRIELNPHWKQDYPSIIPK
jgi:glycosyltransferase involved in cell wall biosynthesis